MIFILPEPHRNYQVNTNFIKYYMEHPETHMYADGHVNFIISGSIPQVSYSGEVNNNGVILQFHSNCLDLFSSYHRMGTAIIIDCSSHFITDFNDYDVLGNMVLTIGNSYGDTGIKVSNNYAYDYFHAKYPNCRMIAAAHYSDDPGERVFFLKEIWNGVETPKINTPRSALRVNSICDTCDAEVKMKCLESENLNAIVFSKESVFETCAKQHQNLHDFVLQNDAVPQLIQQGHKYFILPNYYQYPIVQVREYVKNLIKPEYRESALNHIMLMLQ